MRRPPSRCCSRWGSLTAAKNSDTSLEKGCRCGPPRLFRQRACNWVKKNKLRAQLWSVDEKRVPKGLKRKR